MDEVVQLFDARHRPDGTAPRSRVRRQNLRHGATGVVVRDRLGRIYVHRRTETKDVYPGLHDCCAGGVMLAGEDPDDSARREVAEELGVTGGRMRRIGTAYYTDAQTTYVAFQYEVEYDGPIRWQPEEVAWGSWMPFDELAQRLDEPDWPFVPDSRELIGAWVAARAGECVEVGTGWDNRVAIVEGRWVDRFPRTDDVHERLRAESSLMPSLATTLPLEVPLAEPIGELRPRFRHRLVAGEPLSGSPTHADGRRLGAFLRVLHDIAPATGAGSGIPGPARAAAQLRESLARFSLEVLPRVPAQLLPAAERLLEQVGGVHTSLVHADLGLTHVLRAAGALSGVIGWANVHVGDPARDLAWALYEAGGEFAAGVGAAYGVTETERVRAADWHRLGPWYEVMHGLDTGRADSVESGMRGVVDRLRR